MFILENVPLNAYSTMKLGGRARYLTEINNVHDIQEAGAWAKQHALPVIMIGTGSNVIWTDGGFSGLVLVNKIPGFETFEEDKDTVFVTIGGGENWDHIVKKTVDKGLSGIECLSLIPGTAGATPVQNVGAYGQEIAQSLMTLQAYDMNTGQLVTLRGSECEFAYRTSRFKTKDKNRFFITNITLRLTRKQPQPPFYKDVEALLREQNVTTPTVQEVRDAVVSIRTKKLPDVNKVANCGSFFGNPVLARDDFRELLDMHPELGSSQSKWTQKPFWDEPDGNVKVSAARLLELSGFDDIHDEETGIGQWPKQNLILVNEKALATADLLAFRQRIVDAVGAKFGIVLEQEPELYGD